jgi:endoglucanase Acf2
MAQNGNGKKYTLSATLISLLVHTISTNAAPFEQHNRRAADGGGKSWGNNQGSGYSDDDHGGGHTSWDHSGKSASTWPLSGTGSYFSSGSVSPSGSTRSTTIPTMIPAPSSLVVTTPSTTQSPTLVNTPTPLAVTFSTTTSGGSTVLTAVPVATTSTAADAPGVFAQGASTLSTATSSVVVTSGSAAAGPSTLAHSLSTSITVSSVVSLATSPPAQASSASSPVAAVQGASTLATVGGANTTTTFPRSSATSQTGVISQSVGGVFAETLSSNTITPTDTPTIKPATTGSVGTTLQTGGNPSVVPFPTTVITATSATISPTSLNGTASRTVNTAVPSGTNIFTPIGTDPAPYMVGPKGGHPIPRTGISDNITTPIETNKFYAGLFLADQTDSVWTHPYSIRWAKGVDNIKSWGMAISHIERSQVTYGPGTPAQYYVNPIGIDSLVFSALEFGSSTVLTTDSHEAFSVNAHLAPSAGVSPLLTMPLVQGMGFVTAIYSSGTPLIQSGVFFKALSPLSVSNGISKTTATLQDGTQWVIYVIPTNSKSSPNIILNDSQTVQISSGFTGVIQVAKLAGGNSAAGVYDSSAGVYAVSGAVSGTIVSQFTVSTTGTTTASYSLSWTKQGDTSKTLIMFALPHHVQSFDGTTGALKTNITLQTTTKGISTGFLADSWTMIEQLANNMTFAPYSPTSGSVTKLPAAAVSLIAQTAAEELGEDISAQTNLDTMYFSGKALAKFAAIIYTAHDLANNAGIAAAGLVKLEAAYNVFVQNHQTNPLVYDTTWKGAVSSAGWKDIGADYGGRCLRPVTNISTDTSRNRLQRPSLPLRLFRVHCSCHRIP